MISMHSMFMIVHCIRMWGIIYYISFSTHQHKHPARALQLTDLKFCTCIFTLHAPAPETRVEKQMMCKSYDYS